MEYSQLKKLIHEVPDFPIKGVLFRDMSPLLASPQGFSRALTALAEPIDLSQVDLIAGIESRGFILASALASKHQKGFVPIRKKGKLPPPVESYTYTLEYGQDVLEMKKGQGRALIVDDVLATGGTLKAAITLCQRAGYEVKDIVVLMNLRYLNNFQWQQRTIKAVFEYNE